MISYKQLLKKLWIVLVAFICFSKNTFANENSLQIDYEKCLSSSILSNDDYLTTFDKCMNSMAAAMPICNQKSLPPESITGNIRGVNVDKRCFDEMRNAYKAVLIKNHSNLSKEVFQRNSGILNQAETFNKSSAIFPAYDVVSYCRRRQEGFCEQKQQALYERARSNWRAMSEKARMSVLNCMDVNAKANNSYNYAGLILCIETENGRTRQSEEAERLNTPFHY